MEEKAGPLPCRVQRWRAPFPSTWTGWHEVSFISVFQVRDIIEQRPSVFDFRWNLRNWPMCNSCLFFFFSYSWSWGTLHLNTGISWGRYTYASVVMTLATYSRSVCVLFDLASTQFWYTSSMVWWIAPRPTWSLWLSQNPSHNGKFQMCGHLVLHDQAFCL